MVEQPAMLTAVNASIATRTRQLAVHFKYDPYASCKRSHRATLPAGQLGLLLFKFYLTRPEQTRMQGITRSDPDMLRNATNRTLTELTLTSAKVLLAGGGGLHARAPS